jgi:Histidine kinase-, DNA gyrase B-, and HSP90-like ATPase
MAKLDSVFKGAATPEAEVRVDISYDIIKQVSAQLYTNPRKAIEELVCNSYDAGATECHVKLPQDTTDALVVLDNGKSMDLQGLKNLWMVAKSPKGPDASGRRIANNRLQIGKFGIGKLAAYALGKQLTHVATIKGITRVVSVSEDKIKERKRGGAPRFKVYKLKESEARAVLEPFLGNLPRPWDNSWDTWTMAVVEDVEKGNFVGALKIGILRRMITNALPTSNGFKVVLEGQTVPLRETPDIERTVEILDPNFRKKLETNLREYWKDKLNFEKREDVSPELYKIKVVKISSPGDVTQQIPAIDVPELGPVAGNAILAKQTLTTGSLDERGYVNHGFAIYANGKLVNPEDELFGVSQRSHSYWRRFLARVEMPGLDEVLLVQRNAVSENQPKAQVAREVMRTLFEFTRSLAEAEVEEENFVPETFGSKIGKVSPLLAPLAMEGLAGGRLPEGGLRAVDIDFVTLAENSSAAQYDGKERAIHVNVEHPIIAALSDLKEQNQKQWRRVLGEIVAGGKLAEGFLAAKGVNEEIIFDLDELFDASLRSAASYIRDPVEEYIREIDEASYVGKTRFENAVVNALKSMRLVARRIGGPDNPDGIVEIPVTGTKNLIISIEAKGTKGIITHQELSQATVARHEEDFGCTCSVAIAREFQVQGISGRESGLIRETEGKLTLLSVPAIAKMLRLHRQRPFTYDKVAKILTTWTRPDKLENFVEATWRELPELGLMRLVLQVAHDKVQEQDQNFPDPGMLVGDGRLSKRHVTKDQIRHILEAVAVTTGMIVIKDQANYEFDMKAPVETILEAMACAAKEEVATLPQSR